MTTKKAKQPTEVLSDSKALQAMQAQVNECLALVKQAKSTLGTTSPALTKQQKRRTPKPRTGSADVLQTIARLTTEQGIVLPKHPVGTMLQNLQTVQTLAPLKAAILALQKVVDDVSLAADGASWNSGTAMYTVLRRVQGDDGDLEAALAPLASFFKKGINSTGTKKKTSKATEPTASAPAGEGTSARTAEPAAAAQAPSSNQAAATNSDSTAESGGAGTTPRAT
jgi:hypothetical protein